MRLPRWSVRPASTPAERPDFAGLQAVISCLKEMMMPLPTCGRASAALAFAILAAFAAPSLADPFLDVSRQAGVDDKGRGKGVAWADVDGDGFLDVFVSNKGGPSR